MRQNPQVYADAMNKFNRERQPLGGQRITVRDVLQLAEREAAMATMPQQPPKGGARA